MVVSFWINLFCFRFFFLRQPANFAAREQERAGAVNLRKRRLKMSRVRPDGLHVLEFAQLDDGAIKLTAAGYLMAQASTDERKKLFRGHLLRFLPLVTHIRQVLNEREDHSAPRARFEFELQDHRNASDAEKALRTAIGWGRYAELFAYDDATRSFRLADGPR